MKRFIYLFAAFVSVYSCNDKIPLQSSSAQNETALTSHDSLAPASSSTVAADSVIPACIEKKIDSIKQQPVWNPPAEIYEYLYNDRKVYLISSNCCDFFSTAVDSVCRYVCAPSGGFTGRGDGKCTDFFEKGKQLRLVWKDDRKKR